MALSVQVHKINFASILRKFIMLLFLLGSSTLVRKAQNDFLKLDGQQQPLRGLFPFDSSNTGSLKDSFDDGNIQKVINILQTNIKQWSFIESQLLEPNVNLGMPEIFIPLKHLTTTLEILGNIFFVQNDLSEAKNCLERACPLMELLPASLLTSTEQNQGASIDLNIRTSEGQSMRIDGGDGFFLIGNNIRTINGIKDRSGPRGNYAEGCFALLRDVYSKLYGSTLRETGRKKQSGTGKPRRTAFDVPTSRQKVGPISTSNSIKSKHGRTKSAHVNGHLPVTVMNHNGLQSQHDIVNERPPQSFSDDSSKSESEPENQLDVATEQRRKKLASIFTLSEDEDWEEDVQNFVSSCKNGDKCMSNQNLDNSKAQSHNVYDVTASVVNNPLWEDEFHIDDFDSDDQEYDDFDEDNFDTDEKFAELRSPFEHLRKELTDKGVGDAVKTATDSSQPSSSSKPHVDSSIIYTSSPDGGPSNNRLLKTKAGVENDYGSSAPGYCTSIISEDLEVMLRKFATDEQIDGRKKILHSARKYFDELDMTFPNMDYNEYAANMDMGQVFLEVMGRVCEEGFDFIAEELESWHIERLSKLLEGDMSMTPDYIARDDQSGQQIIELNPSDSKDPRREIVVKFSGKLFNAFTLPERNRLLVLSSFDIVRSEPNDPFNIGFGFNLGILDNDRSNNGVALIGKALKDAVTSSSTFENLGAQSEQRYISFDSLFGEIRDYHHIASGDLYMRKLYSSEDFFSSRASMSSSSINGEPEANYKSRSSQATSHSRRKRKFNRSNNKDDFDVDTDPQTIAEEGSQIRADSSKDSAAAFYEDTLSTTVGLSAPFRSAVPTLSSEGDWILTMFLLFTALTALMVFVARQADSNKKRNHGYSNNAGRNRLRGGSAKKGFWFGIGIVDYLYAYLFGGNANTEEIHDGSDSTGTIYYEGDMLLGSLKAACLSNLSAAYSSIGSSLTSVTVFISNSFKNSNSSSSNLGKTKRGSDKSNRTSSQAPSANQSVQTILTATEVSKVGVSEGNPSSADSALNVDGTKALSKSNSSGDINQNGVNSNSSLQRTRNSNPMKKMSSEAHSRDVAVVSAGSLEPPPPLIMNSRRVSWSVTNVTTDSTSIAPEASISSAGNWAEARKKSSKKHQEKTQQSAPHHSTSSVTVPNSANKSSRSIVLSTSSAGQTDTTLINDGDKSDHSRSAPQLIHIPAVQHIYSHAHAQNPLQQNVGVARVGGSYKNAVNSSTPNSGKNISNGTTSHPESNAVIMKGKNESGPALPPNAGSTAPSSKHTSSLSTTPIEKPTNGMPEDKFIPVLTAENSRTAFNSNYIHGAPPGLVPASVHPHLNSHAFPYFHQPSNPPVYNTAMSNSSFGMADLELPGIDGNIYRSPQRNALSGDDRFLVAPTSGLWGNSDPTSSLDDLMQSINMNRPGRVSDFFHDAEESDDLGLINPGNLLDLDFLGKDPSAPQSNNDSSLRSDFIPNITLEASSLLSGLSPNAPSFRPSQQHSALPHSTADVFEQVASMAMDFDSSDGADRYHFEGDNDNEAYASEEFIKSFYDIIDG